MAVPVYIVSGFLGAGKTTLINHMLSTVPAQKKLAVIVNEFGAISIDGKIIEYDKPYIIDMQGGCVCCTMAGIIIPTIRSVVMNLAPNAVLIETTGLALPQDVARQVQSPALRDCAVLEGIAVMVDSAHFLNSMGDIPILSEQLEGADTVILNKTDLVSEEELAQVEDTIRNIASNTVRFILTSFGAVSFEELFGTDRNAFLKRFAGSAPSRKKDSTRGFVTISYLRNPVLPLDAIEKCFVLAGEKIVRAKGVLKTATGNKLLQYSQSGLEIFEYGGTLNRSELVLIVGEQNQDTVKEIFGCL